MIDNQHILLKLMDIMLKTCLNSILNLSKKQTLKENSLMKRLKKRDTLELATDIFKLIHRYDQKNTDLLKIN